MFSYRCVPPRVQGAREGPGAASAQLLEDEAGGEGEVARVGGRAREGDALAGAKGRVRHGGAERLALRHGHVGEGGVPKRRAREDVVLQFVARVADSSLPQPSSLHPLLRDAISHPRQQRLELGVGVRQLVELRQLLGVERVVLDEVLVGGGHARLRLVRLGAPVAHLLLDLRRRERGPLAGRERRRRRRRRRDGREAAVGAHALLPQRPNVDADRPFEAGIDVDVALRGGDEGGAHLRRVVPGRRRGRLGRVGARRRGGVQFEEGRRRGRRGRARRDGRRVRRLEAPRPRVEGEGRVLPSVRPIAENGDWKT